MFKRQRTGSVVCASCGSLVGVNDEQCYTCGRRNPGLWGYGPLLRRLGTDFGFVPLVIYGCVALYMLSLIVTVMTGGNVMGGGLFSLLSPGALRHDAAWRQRRRIRCSGTAGGGRCSARAGSTAVRCTFSST